VEGLSGLTDSVWLMVHPAFKAAIKVLIIKALAISRDGDGVKE
jgi:hypothetical protein